MSLVKDMKLVGIRPDIMTWNAMVVPFDAKQVQNGFVWVECSVRCL